MLLLTIMLTLTLSISRLKNTFDIYTLEKPTSIHLSISVKMLIKLMSVI